MMVCSAGVLLPLIVLAKATIERKLTDYPDRAATLLLFMLLFAVLGFASAKIYRKLEKSPSAADKSGLKSAAP